jgi:hypothetical protein
MRNLKKNVTKKKLGTSNKKGKKNIKYHSVGTVLNFIFKIEEIEPKRILTLHLHDHSDTCIGTGTKKVTG